ncbi:type II secretion system protein [Lysinibacillus pakistanensis]|uniref:type II secretion system protein n=1 Tax=Lysinibacillus pakistanensis TaxID=759811 RepID=UPI003D2BFB9B
MFKKLMNKKLLKNQKGLTLIELLAVIVILAIVAAIAVPAIGNIIENSRYNAVKADAINALNAANLYYTDNPGGENVTTGTDAIGNTTTSITIEQLKKAKYLDSGGKLEGSTASGVSISAGNPRKISGEITYSGKKTVKFNATITKINADTQKGSQDTISEIKD